MRRWGPDMPWTVTRYRKYKQEVSSGTRINANQPARYTRRGSMHCSTVYRQYQTACSWMFWQQRPQQSVLSWGMAQVQVQQHLILIKQIARFHFIWCIVPILLVTWISGYSQKTLKAMLCLVQHKPQSHMHLFAMAQLDVRRHET